MSDKLTKKELKAPDAFQKVGGEARDWLEGHARTVGIIVGVILLGWAGAVLANYVSNRNDEKAAKELGAALKVLARPVTGADNAEVAPPDPDEAPFKTEKEKNEAVVKALTDFRAKHGGTPSAATAALALAQFELKQGNYDQAVSAYQDFLKGAAKDDALRATAYEGMGYAYEAKKDYAQALSAFQEMAKENKSEFLAGMGTFHQGRILALQGKKDEAAKLLSDLTTSNPGTAAARMASDRLTVLASEGVKIPTPTPPATPTPTPPANGTNAGQP